MIPMERSGEQGGLPMRDGAPRGNVSPVSSRRVHVRGAGEGVLSPGLPQQPAMAETTAIYPGRSRRPERAPGATPASAFDAMRGYPTAVVIGDSHKPGGVEEVAKALTRAHHRKEGTNTGKVAILNLKSDKTVLRGVEDDVDQAGISWERRRPSPDGLLGLFTERDGMVSPYRAAGAFVDAMLAQRREPVDPGFRTRCRHEVLQLMTVLTDWSRVEVPQDIIDHGQDPDAMHRLPDIPPALVPRITQIRDAAAHVLLPQQRGVQPGPYGRFQLTDNVSTLTDEQKELLTGPLYGIYETIQSLPEQEQVLKAILSFANGLLPSGTRDPITRGNAREDESSGEAAPSSVNILDLPTDPNVDPSLKQLLIKLAINDLKHVPVDMLLVLGAGDADKDALRKMREEHNGQVVLQFDEVTDPALAVMGGYSVVATVGNVPGTGAGSAAQILAARNAQYPDGDQPEGLPGDRKVQLGDVQTVFAPGYITVFTPEGQVFRGVPIRPTLEASDNPVQIEEEYFVQARAAQHPLLTDRVFDLVGGAVNRLQGGRRRIALRRRDRIEGGTQPAVEQQEEVGEIGTGRQPEAAPPLTYPLPADTIGQEGQDLPHGDVPPEPWE